MASKMTNSLLRALKNNISLSSNKSFELSILSFGQICNGHICDSVRTVARVVTILVLAICTCRGTFLASTDPMEDLYDLEMSLVQMLEKYLREQQNILTLLSGRYEQAVLSLSNIGSREAFISNPINCFAMLRRLAKDWPKTLSLLQDERYWNITLPSEKELAGGAQALSRLQEVYDLSTERLAEGRLPGTHSKAVLTAADCVIIAQFYYLKHNYPIATDWLLQALQKVFDDQSCPPGLVLENLFITTCFEGDQELSSFYLQELLNRYPLYTPPESLLEDFNLALKGKCMEFARQRYLLKTRSVPELDDEEIAEYHGACRGLGRISGSLQCRLIHYGHPFLRLQPVKMEELHLEPPVLMFHDVISHQGVKYIKDAAFPLMQRAQVQMPDGVGRTLSYRTSLVAWLPPEDKICKWLDRWIALYTGLDVGRAEQLQVSKYGLAGEYILHMDAIQEWNLTHGGPDGNRLATFMIYLSDVPLGGHTVFPDLGVSVKPRKGAAVFWYNLHHDGSRDCRMRHASCPVIVGSKWVVNKWLHEAGQEFQERPPCLRHQQDSRKYFYL